MQEGESKFRICAAVQAWLGFSGGFLNKPDEIYGNGDMLSLYQLRYMSEKCGRFSDETQSLLSIYFPRD
jgi:hypothetical protein